MCIFMPLRIAICSSLYSRPKFPYLQSSTSSLLAKCFHSLQMSTYELSGAPERQECTSYNSSITALAGLRVGFGAFPLNLVDYLWRAKQPYNVSVAAEVAGCAALTNLDYMRNVGELCC